MYRVLYSESLCGNKRSTLLSCVSKESDEFLMRLGYSPDASIQITSGVIFELKDNIKVTIFKEMVYFQLYVHISIDIT
jgi:hypothetical protein